MPKLLHFMRWLTALGTLLVLVLFAWQCIDIYVTGNSLTNLDENGVHILNVYRMEDVAGRLKGMAIPLIAYAIILAATCVLTHRCPEQPVASRRSRRNDVTQPTAKKQLTEKGSSTNVIRAVLFAVAVLFIVLGVLNGGWYDVLVKAINICTECIGLG